MSLILVTHPGRQHSHQAALGLHRAGLLAGYWSGVPSVARNARFVPPRLWRRAVRYAPVELPPERTRWVPFVPALRRAADALLPPGLAAAADFHACRWFDRWAAARLGCVAGRAVVACEISARDTFAAAKQRGWLTLLDAPSFHHAAQDRLHGFREPEALHRRITRLKDQEIALADHVLTVSALARATYLEAGVAAERVHALMLGVDLELFGKRAATPVGPLRLVFGGAMLKRKGFDILVDAFAQALRQGLAAELRVVGPDGDASDALRRLPPGVVRRSGSLPQSTWAEELRASDLLVLPSRNDSYGMVVLEALACGVPVLVTDQVGAKDLVTPGETGFVIAAGDRAALTAALLEAGARRDALRGFTQRCRTAAEGASWAAYHSRLAALVRRLLAEQPGAA